MAARRSYEESCRVRGRDPVPRLGRRPSFDAAEGEDWFHSQTTGEDLRDLTMPHLALGRALVEDTRFDNTDLSQSLLNWSDFIRVSFAGADLHDSDLRNSTFEGCDFTGAALDGCDLRCSQFAGCGFDGASLRGATLTEAQRKSLPLSAEQRQATITDTEDDAPGG